MLIGFTRLLDLPDLFTLFLNYCSMVKATAFPVVLLQKVGREVIVQRSQAHSLYSL